ncbi:MAG TPA: TetR/AcrR family transcriptional regulator [Solirubrobacteraceae bacterium]|nr:TetR/AcrR family transcriptional regulator [Solirubrobacteraceae bacterium]
MSSTPRTARGRATRERILKSATELIAERGIAGTSLDHVRALAEVSKSQLYLYFPDRETLLREVASSTCDGVLDGQADILADFHSPAGIERYLDALVELQFDFERPSGCPIATLAGQLDPQDEQARLILADGMDRWEAGLREGLEQMRDGGELKPGTNPSKLATQTLALLQGGLVLARVRDDAAQMRLAADTALALIRSAVLE